MKQRLLELALEALAVRKASIDAEIEAIKQELSGRPAAAAPAAKVEAPKTGRRKRSAASRKAQSEKMKAIWAARKAAQAKRAGGKGK